MFKKSIILILLFVLMGCGTTNKEEPKTEFDQLEIVNNEVFEFQVLDAFRSFGDNSLLLEDDYLFAVVSIRIKNISSSKQTISTYNFKMQNDQGTEVDTSWNSSLGSNSFSGELLPNGEIEGFLYFEQPIENSGLKLVYYNSIFEEEPDFKFILNCDCSVPKLEKDLFSISEVVTYNDIDNSIVGVKKSVGSGYSKAQSGYTFIGITIKTNNNSRESVSINSYNWKIVDDNGVQYDTTYFSPFDDAEYPTTTLLSKGEVSGILIYEVPNNVGLKLSYYPSYFDEEIKYSFDLN